jgi:hypothetical protein
MQQKGQMPFVFKMQGQTGQVEETRENVQLEIKIRGKEAIFFFCKVVAL